MICPECENGKIWHPFAHIKNSPSFCKWEPCNRCQGSGVAYCCDGEDFVSLESAQDHKRIGENDTGPNTGGMGAYSPAPIFTPKIKEQVDREIITPTLKALKKNGHPYKGILYAGLMIKDGYARLVEYNIRFGDPECQVLMLRMKNDLIKLIG